MPDMAKQNQDSFIVHPKIMGSYSHHLFGVADGHGQYGKEVSTIIKQRYPHLFEKNIRIQSIPEAFKITSAQVNTLIDKEIEDIEFSGSTCVIVYINDQELYTANIGDSRAIIGTYEVGKSNFGCKVGIVIEGRDITRDHKPDEADEAARILSNGGRIDSFKGPEGEDVGPLRVWQKDLNVPGLAMTRALGDGAGRLAGVISIPGNY
jgi:serine/threonine protein phosphatase PrpC